MAILIPLCLVTIRALYNGEDHVCGQLRKTLFRTSVKLIFSEHTHVKHCIVKLLLHNATKVPGQYKLSSLQFDTHTCM